MRYNFCFFSILLFLCSVLFLGCENKSDYFYYNSDEDFFQNNRGLSDTELIGKLIFFDKNLSEPAGTSCSSCHSPMAGFSDPRHTSFSEGATHQFSHRNAGSISYNSLAPNRRLELVRGNWEGVGGFFWDGKAEFLKQQALFPLTNSHEMNNPNFGVIAEKIKKATYYSKMQHLFGNEALADSQTIVMFAVICLQSFEQSFQVNPFTSKFDFYKKGLIKLTEQETRGMQLFNDTLKSKCSICHLTTPTTYASTNEIIFTDFSYDNIGLPKNPAQKNEPIDSGLATFEFRNPLEVGRFKAPSLRNITITYPYMHSGIFTNLEEVLEFYNKRDVLPKFAHPEVSSTINAVEIGNLKLSEQETKDIIAFLNTLTDGYKIKNKK